MPIRSLSLAGAALAALAAAEPSSAPSPSLGLHPDVTWTSIYMAHGWDLSKRGPAVQPSLALDAALPGLQFKAWTSFTIDRDEKQTDESDNIISYARTWFADTAVPVQTQVFGNYWFLPHSEPSTQAQFDQGLIYTRQSGFKLGGGVALPQALSLAWLSQVVPAYNLYAWTPDVKDRFTPGCVHEFALNGTVPLTSLGGMAGVRHLDIGGTMNYNSGVFDQERGWSHATASLGLPLDICTCVLKPTVNYQWSFESTVNERNECWASVSLSRDF